MRRLAWIIAVCSLVGCGADRSKTLPSPVARVQPSPSPWILTCVDPTADTPALLWNDAIGMRLGRDGTGYDSAGKPLPSFLADRYESTNEEKIVVCANPAATKIQIAGETLSPSDSSDYVQSLDMMTGLLSTKWTQGSTKVQVDTVLDPERPVLAQRWTLSPGTGRQIAIQSEVAAMDRKEALLKDFGNGLALLDFYPGKKQALVQISSHGVAAGKWSSDSDGYEFGGTLADGELVTIDRVVTIGSKPVSNPKFEEVFKRSRTAWKARWETDIVIDGPVEDQQAVHSFLFYLRASIPPRVSPFGLSNAMYGGHVFWDADIWAFPALSLIEPVRASRIPNYRLGLVDAARSNFRVSWSKGELNAEHDQLAGLKFPWESSVSGAETCRATSIKELHITGSVLWSLMQAFALGLAPSPKHLLEEAGQFYVARSAPGADGLELKGVMSPDENHVGDNDLYTNLLAQWCANGGSFEGSIRFKLPRDAKSFLTYDGDPVKSYKQAAAVLAIYPLQFAAAERQARQMMDRFASKSSENGPAMSDSIYAVIWSRIGDGQAAYKAWRESWQPFTERPLALFSEKRTPPDAGTSELEARRPTFFVTGAAGSLQSVIAGFLGFRLDLKPEAGSAWSIPLKGGYWLSVKPHLPPAWKSVKFKNFTVLGKRYTLDADRDHAKVTQGD